jgi:hypothetical protein
MEQLAMKGGHVDAYPESMRDPWLYDAAWDKSDASWSAIGVLERSGRYPEAVGLLESQFNEAVHSESYGALQEAQEIVDELSVLPDTKETAEALQRLLGARINGPEPFPAQTIPARHLNILVVRGDERQARLNDEIRTKIHRECPNVTLSFRHAGWSGN